MEKHSRCISIFSLIVLIIVAGCSGQDRPGIGILSGTVAGIVDGDTLHVKLTGGQKEKVRLIGVDTPESTRETEPYGKKAATYTKEKLDGKQIWLELDVEKRDRYGRLLAYIWLEKPAGVVKEDLYVKMFNAALVCEGYARVMTVPPNVKYADRFVAYQREAREGNKGLWGLDGQAEKYYLASDNSNKFHRPDCRWGQKIKPQNLIKFESIDEAYKEGYEPCRVCDP